MSTPVTAQTAICSAAYFAFCGNAPAFIEIYVTVLHRSPSSQPFSRGEKGFNFPLPPGEGSRVRERSTVSQIVSR